MGLEAQEVAVRIRYLGGTQFNKEAAESARAVEGIGTAAERAGKKTAGRTLGTRTAEEVGQEAGLLSLVKNSAKVLSEKGRQLDKIATSVQNVGRAALPVSAGLGFVGYEAIKSSMSVGQAFKLLETQAFASRQQVKELEQDTRGMATRFGTTPTEIAQALYPLQSSFKNVKQDVEGLTASLMGAKIGLDTLPNTSNAVAGTMKAHMKDIHSATEAMAVMDYIVGSGKLHLPELTESLTTGILQQASQMGVSFREIGALDAAMAKSTVPPSQENTRMRLILTKLGAASSAEEIKALRSIGLEKFSLAHDLEKPGGGLLYALKDLSNHLDKLPKVEQNLKLGEMFGQSRGFATIAGMLEELKSAEKINATLHTASSASLTEHFKQTEETEAFKLSQLKGAYYETMTELGRSLSPTVIPLLKEAGGDLASLVKDFNELPGPIKQGAGMLAIFGFAFGPVVYMFGNLLKVASGVMRLFGWLGEHVIFSTEEASAARAIGLDIAGMAADTLVTGGALYVLYYLFTHKPPNWFYEVLGLKSTISNKQQEAQDKSINKREAEVGKGTLQAKPMYRTAGGGLAEALTPKEAQTLQKKYEQETMKALKDSLKEAFKLEVPLYVDGRKIAEAVHKSDREVMARR